MKKIGIASLLFCLLFQTTFAQQEKIYTTKEITLPIKIDGNLDEKSWNEAKWEGNFIQNGNGKKPTFDTQFKILYDQNNLYVAIRAFDKQPDSILVPITLRDAFGGDWVEINIDSDFDRKDAFSFTITAAGIRGDEYIKTSENWFNDWNPNWTAKTQIDKKGWVAEIKIAFSELEIHAKKEHWSIQVNRRMGRFKESSSWTSIPDEDKWVEYFGLLQGIENIPISKAVSLTDKIKPEFLKKDFSDLYNSLKSSYPSLYRYHSSDYINENYRQTLKALEKEMTMVDFYKTISSYISKIGDGHMKVELPDYFANTYYKKLKKILADDVERIEQFIAHDIPDVVKAIILPMIILGYLFTVNWLLALMAFLFTLLIILFISKSMATEKHKRNMRKYHQSLEDMNAGIVEFVRAMPVMKIFGQSASAFKKYSNTVEDFDKLISNWTKMNAPMWAMLMSFLTNALLPVLILGLFLYFDNNLELSVLFLFLILGVGYIKPMFALTSFSPQLAMINHGVKRIDEILFNIDEQKTGRENFPHSSSLEFNNVAFFYKENVPVLKNVSFTIPQGNITALVGPSGSGKSTIAQLIPRFYDVNTGTITISGININELSENELMKNVGFVFQDNMMFYQSIFDNILMGMDKTKEEVIRASKIARCHDFISHLPNGYYTHFGDKGVHLSGGEQQRIQLARVVLKDAPILILDEATAFSDPENEQLIMEAFSELIQNKTVLIIAHRLSTIVEVDQIIVINNGEVDNMGTHKELLEKSKLYSQMWNAHTRAKEFEITNN